MLLACRPTPGGQQDTQRDLDNSPTERKAEGTLTDNGSDVPGSPQTVRQTGETAKSVEVSGAEDEARNFQELSRPSRVKCWVGGLIVKQFPGNNMPKAATMAEGEEAEYLYQRTFLASEYTFKGQKIRDYWYLIKKADGTIGWVHGGGVKFLATEDAGPSNAKPDAVNTEKAKIENDWVFVPGKRVGSVFKATSETDLVQRFGAENVKRGEVKTSLTKTENCTYVYQGTPDELALTWTDFTRTKVKAVYLNRKGGRWHSPEGLRTGISLTELIKLNEAPLAFSGFDWEYSGVVSDWKKGKLAKYTKGFYAVLHYNTDSTPQELVKQNKGNKTLSSASEKVKYMDLYVQRLVVYLD